MTEFAVGQTATHKGSGESFLVRSIGAPGLSFLGSPIMRPLDIPVLMMADEFDFGHATREEVPESSGGDQEPTAESVVYKESPVMLAYERAVHHAGVATTMVDRALERAELAEAAEQIESELA